MSSVENVVARSVVSPVARAVGAGIGGGGYDADAVAYFAAVEGVGGSFDLSGINATYTESYVKDAHNTLFTQLKSNGLWSKITELYLLVGKTFDGITIKAKGTGLITNNNFVSGDYLAAGSGAGLTGTTNKWLGTGLAANSIGGTEAFLFVYAANLHNGPSGDAVIIGASTTVANALAIQTRAGGGSVYRAFMAGLTDGTAPHDNAALIVTSRSSTDFEMYVNGATDATRLTSRSDATTTTPIALMANATSASTASAFSSSTAKCLAVGDGLTDTEAANLTTRIETFMDALGAGIGGSGIDADAAAYFATVEGAGGSFDLTGINATYTEEYIKAAISSFVAGLKSDGAWSLLDEYYLFCAKDWAGRAVKLKGSGGIGIVNFVLDDWTGAGSNTGIKSDGSLKALQPGFTPASSEDISFGGYITQLNTIAGRYYMGQGAAAAGGQGVGSETVAGQFRVYRSGGSTNLAGHQTGSFAYTRRGVADHELYSRGASIWTDTASGLDSEAVFQVGHFFSLFHNGRLATSWIGKGITDPIALAISNREHALLTAIGGNAY